MTHSAILLQNAESGECNGRTWAATAGKWRYKPTGWDSGKSATLQHEGQEVQLQYSSSAFEDFLDAMSRIRNECNRRSQCVAPLKASAGERSGQMSRV